MLYIYCHHVPTYLHIHLHKKGPVVCLYISYFIINFFRIKILFLYLCVTRPVYLPFTRGQPGPHSTEHFLHSSSRKVGILAYYQLVEFSMLKKNAILSITKEINLTENSGIISSVIDEGFRFSLTAKTQLTGIKQVLM